MKFNTHLMLVSAQPTPNLTPVLDPGVRPRRVVLLTSPDMRERAAWLEAVYRPRGVVTDQWPISNAWDIEAIQGRVLEFLESEDALADAGELALNATGGTKPMSIAAYEVFRDCDCPIYYVHPEEDRLIWMHPSGRPPHALADVVRIPDFVLAHGGRVQAEEDIRIPPAFRDFTQELVRDIGYFEKALGRLNWYASEARDGLRSPSLEVAHEFDDAFQDLLDRLDVLGVLRVSDGRILFTDEAARFFANGGWLEQHVHAAMNALRGRGIRIQDARRGLQIEWQTGHSRNEIDVAFLVDNRLHVIECKTRGWVERGAGADALYRLDSLADAAGGLQARAMLVSYRRMGKGDVRRAKDLGIEVVQGGQIAEMAARLQRWVKPG